MGKAGHGESSPLLLINGGVRNFDLDFCEIINRRFLQQYATK